MEIRIYRKWVKENGQWVPRDELQYRGSGIYKDDWLPVPVVEESRPQN